MEFLSDLKDIILRKQLESLFSKCIEMAKEYHPNYIPIHEVKDGGNCWSDKGIIQFDFLKEEVGTLFHEIFHSAYHPSEFHEGGSNEDWGEAFCDAFRFFSESALNVEGEWHTKIIRFTQQSFDEIMHDSGDPDHDKKYGYPASLIINRIGIDAGEQMFFRFWKELRKKAITGQITLNDYFSYQIKVGPI